MKKIIRRKRGFTLIELLVVVLILAILMAVALPLYLSAVADSETKTCRANLQTISGAVQAYRVKFRLANYGTIISGGPSILAGDLQAVPKCPSNGTYTIENGSSGDNTTYKVTCDKHGSFEPGVSNS